MDTYLALGGSQCKSSSDQLFTGSAAEMEGIFCCNFHLMGQPSVTYRETGTRIFRPLSLYCFHNFLCACACVSHVKLPSSNIKLNVFLFVCVGCFFVKNVTANVKAYRLNKPFSALSVVFTPSCGQRVYSLRAAMILNPSQINTHKHMVYYVQTETANVCLMISSQWQVSTCPRFGSDIKTSSISACSTFKCQRGNVLSDKFTPRTRIMHYH